MNDLTYTKSTHTLISFISVRIKYTIYSPPSLSVFTWRIYIHNIYLDIAIICSINLRIWKVLLEQIKHTPHIQLCCYCQIGLLHKFEYVAVVRTHINYPNFRLLNVHIVWHLSCVNKHTLFGCTQWINENFEFDTSPAIKKVYPKFANWRKKEYGSKNRLLNFKWWKSTNIQKIFSKSSIKNSKRVRTMRNRKVPFKMECLLLNEFNYVPD